MTYPEDDFCVFCEEVYLVDPKDAPEGDFVVHAGHRNHAWSLLLSGRTLKLAGCCPLVHHVVEEQVVYREKDLLDERVADLLEQAQKRADDAWLTYREGNPPVVTDPQTGEAK